MRLTVLLMITSLSLIAGRTSPLPYPGRCKTDSVILGKNDQGSYYAMYRYRSTGKDSATIFGRIRTEEFENPLTALVINDTLYNTEGSYNIRLQKGTYNLKVKTLTDNTMWLQALKLNAGDSVRIDFFLTSDSTAGFDAGKRDRIY